jgi:1-deoxy-D-xylulose-5-phosphate reductoisomerase
LAQLGTPDMRVPIAYGLSFPKRMASGAGLLDFSTIAGLTFEPADVSRFPGLGLAWHTLRGPQGSTAVLNAANEIAVEAFLAGMIRFDQIHQINLATLDAVVPASGDCDSIDALIALDARVRRMATAAAGRLSR